MAGLLGSVVGGALACVLLGLLLGLAFKRKKPDERAIFAAISAWIAAGIIAGFGMANGGPFRFDAILIYLPGTIVAFFYLRWHYRKMWSDEDEAEELERTFR